VREPGSKCGEEELLVRSDDERVGRYLLEDAREPQGMMQHYITAYCAEARRNTA
jgi:hypothetical protein